MLEYTHHGTEHAPRFVSSKEQSQEALLYDSLQDLTTLSASLSVNYCR